MSVPRITGVEGIVGGALRKGKEEIGALWDYCSGRRRPRSGRAVVGGMVQQASPVLDFGISDASPENSLFYLLLLFLSFLLRFQYKMMNQIHCGRLTLAQSSKRFIP